MSWSEQQDFALQKVESWLKHDTKDNPVFRLYGYAGTGKTTLAIHFANMIEGNVCFAAFTGKASMMMRQKGCYGAKTIHSLIYKAKADDKGNVSFVLNKHGSDLKNAKLLILDECSMVNEELAKDLLYFNVPILALGDPAQLPPVSGAGYFTEGKPDVMLTQIHRQAKENPIIALASHVRKGNDIPFGEYGNSVVMPRSKLRSKDAVEASQIIVGKNNTRQTINKKMRKIYGIKSQLPIIGEKIICLKNDRTKGIYNGGIFYVEKILPVKLKKADYLLLEIKSDEEDPAGFSTIVNVKKGLFSDEWPYPDWKQLKYSQEFDYAYAITCHKSQGSQYESVLIYGDEANVFGTEKHRWLYTAITRASERVVIVK